MKDADCTEFLQWALPHLGMRWSGFRRMRGQVCKRLRRRMAELGLAELTAYRALLETYPEEWIRLDGLRRISISRFYRDHGVWRTLEGEILPHLAERARVRGETRLRIWSAGCASGEEPYTQALLFAFSHGGLTECIPEILATDSDPHLLERARRACYPATSLRDVPDSWRAAFEPFGEEHCLRADYRRPVRFLEQDICHAFPEGLFDLILCRNLVFTYFETSLQAEIAKRLAARLTPGGYLLLGIHEFTDSHLYRMRVLAVAEIAERQARINKDPMVLQVHCTTEAAHPEGFGANYLERRAISIQHSMALCI
jgi:chemotaxis protein methyltransferase CheR